MLAGLAHRILGAKQRSVGLALRRLGLPQRLRRRVDARVRGAPVQHRVRVALGRGVRGGRGGRAAAREERGFARWGCDWGGGEGERRLKRGIVVVGLGG